MSNEKKTVAPLGERFKTLIRARRTTVAALASVLFVSACSSVPDAVNPVEWYRSTVDAFSEDGEETSSAESASAEDQAIPGEDDEFPNLASVPDRPSARGNVGKGLVADPNAPQYAPSVSLQGDDNVVVPVTEAPSAPAVPVEPVAEVPAAETAVAETMPEPAESAPTAPEVEVGEAAAAEPMAVSDDAMASAPKAMSDPLVIQPGRLPSGETYEEYRARLMKGLDTAAISSFQPTTGFAGRSAGANDLGTVVVSSTGIQTEAGASNTVFDIASDGISEAGFRRLSRTGNLLGQRSVKVATIHFANGSDALDSQDVHVLRKVAALHQQNGGVVRVIGHASSRTRNMDEVRHKLVNYKVSAERADAVASALVRLGLPKDAIVVGAASDSDPVYLEVMPTGEAGNRRAEIYIDS